MYAVQYYNYWIHMIFPKKYFVGNNGTSAFCLLLAMIPLFWKRCLFLFYLAQRFLYPKFNAKLCPIMIFIRETYTAFSGGKVVSVFRKIYWWSPETSESVVVRQCIWNLLISQEVIYVKQHPYTHSTLQNLNKK